MKHFLIILITLIFVSCVQNSTSYIIVDNIKFYDDSTYLVSLVWLTKESNCIIGHIGQYNCYVTSTNYKVGDTLFKFPSDLKDTSKNNSRFGYEK